jgi:hypothetical protein
MHGPSRPPDIARRGDADTQSRVGRAWVRSHLLNAAGRTRTCEPSWKLPYVGGVPTSRNASNSAGSRHSSGAADRAIEYTHSFVLRRAAAAFGAAASAPSRYAAVGGPNQVVSASASPGWVRSPTQATYPSGRINTAVGAVIAPSAGSSHAPEHLASINRTRSAHGVMSKPPDSPRLSLDAPR